MLEEEEVRTVAGAWSSPCIKQQAGCCHQIEEKNVERCNLYRIVFFFLALYFG